MIVVEAPIVPSLADGLLSLMSGFGHVSIILWVFSCFLPGEILQLTPELPPPKHGISHFSKEPTFLLVVGTPDVLTHWGGVRLNWSVEESLTPGCQAMSKFQRIWWFWPKSWKTKINFESPTLPLLMWILCPDNARDTACVQPLNPTAARTGLSKGVWHWRRLPILHFGTAFIIQVLLCLSQL